MRYDPPVGTAARSLPPRVVSWIWVAGCVAWLALALILAFGVVSWLPRLLWPSFAPDHGMELAAFIATWGVLGMAGAAALARLLLGGVASLRRTGLVAAGAGLVIAAALQVVLHDWAVGKLGYYETDAIGPTVMLPLALAALTVAMFGVAVAPRAFDLAPRVAVVAGGVIVLAIVTLNVPGALDGIAARAIALAVVLASVPGYILVSWAIALRR